MDADLLKARVLGMLHADDLEILLNLNFRRPFERGEVVVAAGEKVDRFYLVEEGTLGVEAEGGGEPRFLHPGQVFGSTSVLLDRPCPTNVIAQEDSIVLTASPRDLDWLTEAEPAVASRLLKC